MIEEITGSFCSIAETGTLVVLTGRELLTETTLLPDTHVAIVRADRIVSGMEETPNGLSQLAASLRVFLERVVSPHSGPRTTPQFVALRRRRSSRSSTIRAVIAVLKRILVTSSSSYC